MDPALVQRITDLVMAELGHASPSPAASPSPGEAVASARVGAGGRKLLLVPDAGDDPLWARLPALAGVVWTAVRSPGVSEARFPSARWIDPPSVWDELVHGMSAVVIPALKLHTLSRVALLLGDAPASAAALAGIMQGVPVLASAQEVERIRRASNRLPAPFLSLFHGHVRTVEGMGVALLEPDRLLARLAGQAPLAAAGVSSAARGRDVLTVADLEAAQRAGQTRLQLTPGTIITPLARDTAAQLGIEVQFS